MHEVELVKLSPKELYNMRLEDKIKKFPSNFFSNKEVAIELFRYLIEDVLKYNDQDILDNIDTYFFTKYKLVTPLTYFFDSSPYLYLDAAYPRKFKKSQMRIKPKGQKHKLDDIEKIKEMIDLLDGNVPKYTDFKKYGLLDILLKRFDGNCYLAVNFVYPNRFFDFEFPEYIDAEEYWDKKKAVFAVCWLVTEKLRISTFKEVISFVKPEHFYENNLEFPLKKFFRGSVKVALVESFYKDLGFDENGNVVKL